MSLVDSGFSAAENEFLAEDTLVTIIPSISHPELLFISGTFGPLESGMPCDVPLWLAITLRKRGKCVIKMPEWMSADSLEQLVEHEKSRPMLGSLPFHFMEIAHLLLTSANEDIQAPDRVLALLQDLEKIRMDRVRIGNRYSEWQFTSQFTLIEAVTLSHRYLEHCCFCTGRSISGLHIS